MWDQVSSQLVPLFYILWKFTLHVVNFYSTFCELLLYILWICALTLRFVNLCPYSTFYELVPLLYILCSEFDPWQRGSMFIISNSILQAHFLFQGRGFQTWEYSPAYAIRSYAYILLHVLPMKLLALFLSENNASILMILFILLETIMPSRIEEQCDMHSLNLLGNIQSS